jgi:small subunit ribosomal protein S16
MASLTFQTMKKNHHHLKILLAKSKNIKQLPHPQLALVTCIIANHFFSLFFVMAVALRLSRQGTSDRPYYKIIAVDSRVRRDGRFIEQLGTYNPMKEGLNYEIDLESAEKWLGNGAKPSETVRSIIRKARTAAK